ncbi:MAG: hypothetical protein H7841_12140 [Magnetospirillum sp. WYHS-4]
MGITTVLSTVTVREMSNAQLLLQMGRYNVTRRLDDQAEVVGVASQKIDSATRESAQWESLRDDLAEVGRYIQAVVDQVGSIQTTVKKMTTTAYSARNQDSISSDTYKFSFDAGLRSVNSAAKDNSLVPNLLGSAPVSDYSYKTNLSGEYATLEPHFVGSDYYILDSDGKKWVREADYQLVLQRRDATTGAATGEQANLSTGIRLDSFDTSTGAVTFTLQDPTTGAWDDSYSGTVYRSGLKILDSWLYDGLATTTGRSNALIDLHRARSAVDVQLAKYQAALSAATYHDERAREGIEGLTNKVDSLTAQQLLALQEVDTKSQFVNGLNRLAVQANTNVRLEYFRMFEANTFTRNLVDALA